MFLIRADSQGKFYHRKLIMVIPSALAACDQCKSTKHHCSLRAIKFQWLYIVILSESLFSLNHFVYFHVLWIGWILLHWDGHGQELQTLSSIDRNHLLFYLTELANCVEWFASVVGSFDSIVYTSSLKLSRWIPQGPTSLAYSAMAAGS